MNDERFVEELITQFLLNTCVLRPHLSPSSIQAARRCVGYSATADDFIPLITGSVAEFYIEPMLPHIGDVDMMVHLRRILAIPEGHSPPTQLPAEFPNVVKVYEFFDSRYWPGYVFLRLRYSLTECVHDGTYNSMEYDDDSRNFFPNFSDLEENMMMHGPAVIAHEHESLPTDFVYCVVWCGRLKPLNG